MALNTITPSNREEEYLSAIAGDEGASAPVPSNRREEWLRRIAEHGESIPAVPEAGDNGKVWTAGSDGSASWETASGGGDFITLYERHAEPSVADLPELSAGLEWEPSMTAMPLSLTPGGDPLTYTELLALPRNCTYYIYYYNQPETQYMQVMTFDYVYTNEYESYSAGDYLCAVLITGTGNQYGIYAEVKNK